MFCCCKKKTIEDDLIDNDYVIVLNNSPRRCEGGKEKHDHQEENLKKCCIHGDIKKKSANQGETLKKNFRSKGGEETNFNEDDKNKKVVKTESIKIEKPMINAEVNSKKMCSKEIKNATRENKTKTTELQPTTKSSNTKTKCLAHSPDRIVVPKRTNNYVDKESLNPYIESNRHPRRAAAPKIDFGSGLRRIRIGTPITIEEILSPKYKMH